MPRLLSFSSGQRLPVVAAISTLLLMTVFGSLLFGWRQARAEPPQLAFTIESTPGAIRPNEYALIQWTGTITNNGLEDANDVMVGFGPSGTLAIPYFFFVSRSLDGVGQPVEPTDLGWRIGDIAAGQTVTLRAETIVRAFGEGRWGGSARVFVGDLAVGDTEVAFDVIAGAPDPPTGLLIDKRFTGPTFDWPGQIGVPPPPGPVSPPDSGDGTDGGDGDVPAPKPWSPPSDGEWPPIMPPWPVSPPEQVSPPDVVTILPVPHDLLVDPPNTSIAVVEPLGLTPPDVPPPEPLSPPDQLSPPVVPPLPPLEAPYEIVIRNDSDVAYTSVTVLDRYVWPFVFGAADPAPTSVDDTVQTATWDLAAFGRESLAPGDELRVNLTLHTDYPCPGAQNALVVVAQTASGSEETYATFAEPRFARIGACAVPGGGRGGGDCGDCFCVDCDFVPALPTDGTVLPSSGNGDPVEGSPDPSAQNDPSSETAGTTTTPDSNADALGLPSAGTGPPGRGAGWTLATAALLTLLGVSLVLTGRRGHQRTPS